MTEFALVYLAGILTGAIAVTSNQHSKLSVGFDLAPAKATVAFVLSMRISRRSLSWVGAPCHSDNDCAVGIGY
jgi:hypothetical protein